MFHEAHSRQKADPKRQRRQYMLMGARKISSWQHRPRPELMTLRRLESQR